MLPALPIGYEARMPRYEEAQDLRSVGCDSSDREALLAPAAADAWLAMQRAAAEDQLPLVLVSAFRSISRQRELLEAKLASGLPWDEILSVAAYPGFSEHHTGRALDLGAPDSADLTEGFETTPQFAWLSRNAHRFGFALSYPRGNAFDIAYEPWHWCFSVRAPCQST
jgi:zinc D-Ala-D-Ala carboxypeptidase